MGERKRSLLTNNIYGCSGRVAVGLALTLGLVVYSHRKPIEKVDFIESVATRSGGWMLLNLARGDQEEAIPLIIPSISSISLSANGSKLGFAKSIGGPNIFITDVNSFNPVLISNEVRGYQLAWSPSGEEIAVTGMNLTTRESGLFVINVNKKFATPLVIERDNKTIFDRPSLSFDGKYAVYISETMDASKVLREPKAFVVNRENKSVRELVSDPDLFQQRAIFSPIENKIVLVMQNHKKRISDLYLVNPDGSDLRQITFNGESVFPSWSPDGKKIVYFLDSTFVFSEIYVIEVNTNQIRQLTHNNYRDEYPEWSPKGNKIFFYSNQDGGWDIFSMNPDGTNQQKIKTAISR